MGNLKAIFTDKAPQPVGPYSQGIVPGSGVPVYLAGQIGLNPESGDIVFGDAKEQTEQVFSNIKAVLAEIGLDLSDIVRMDVLLANIDDFAAMNEVYADEFENHKPARAAFAVDALPKGAKVEIVAVAWKSH